MTMKPKTPTERVQTRIIEAAQLIDLSAEDQKRFAHALIDPPAPAPALVHAARRHDQLIDDREAPRISVK